MLGHQVARQFQLRGETWATVRKSDDLGRATEVLNGVQIYPGVDAMSFDSIVAALHEIRPTVVVNCIGIIKQDSLAEDPTVAIEVNALLPHRIAAVCDAVSAKLIHVSTDCVFSGRKGGYTESDVADATDLYGRSKYLGEVHRAPHLTLRTSIIGPELRTSRSLLDWFLALRGTVHGFNRAIFSGLTTPEMSRVIVNCATNWQHLTGLYQVSAAPINKFELLSLVKSHFGLLTDIQAKSELVIDRSLDSTRFQAITGYRPPSWDEMIAELAALPHHASTGGIYVSSR